MYYIKIHNYCRYVFETRKETGRRERYFDANVLIVKSSF